MDLDDRAVAAAEEGDSPIPTYRRGMRTDSATTIVTRMLLVFAATEFAVGSVLLSIGLLHRDGLFVVGGCMLYIITAGTWMRRWSAKRLAQETTETTPGRK
jgi:hypothetical protein